MKNLFGIVVLLLLHGWGCDEAHGGWYKRAVASCPEDNDEWRSTVTIELHLVEPAVAGQMSVWADRDRFTYECDSNQCWTEIYPQPPICIRATKSAVAASEALLEPFRRLAKNPPSRQE